MKWFCLVCDFASPYIHLVTDKNYRHLIAQALQAFGLDERAPSSPLKGGTANVSFVVDGRERIIVTFCVDLPLERVERLASLLQHLQQHGLESNRLLRSRVGNLVEVVGGVPTIVKSFLEGSVLRVVDQARAHGIGGVLSQLHEVPIPTGYAADHAMNRNNMASIGEAADDPS